MGLHLQFPCSTEGHDWQSTGGMNAGCARGDWCECSVPVCVCTRCETCDYGDNDEARQVRAECLAAPNTESE